VAQLTGPGSLNATDTAWGVSGTDLGHVFSLGDRLYMVFGDTYGPGFSPPPDGRSAGCDWRCNTMAVIADRRPGDGLTFEKMLADRPGHARELIPARRDPNGRTELTVIPTAGIAVGRRMILHTMSVRRWEGHGRWSTNHSGLVYSDDFGATWTEAPAARWAADSGFAQVAIVHSGPDLYFFGIPAGRFGPVKLARVPVKAVLDGRSYRYLRGFAGERAQWGADEAAALPIVPAPAGEPSVAWNDYLGQWVMTCLDESARAIVLREAPQPWGPWSAPQTLVSGDRYPGLYGGYIHPWLTERDGEVIYFTLSQWGTYNVVLMRARLVRQG